MSLHTCIGITYVNPLIHNLGCNHMQKAIVYTDPHNCSAGQL